MRSEQTGEPLAPEAGHQQINPRASGAGAVISWLVILACLGFILLARSPWAPGWLPVRSAADKPPRDHINPQFRFLARYVVGAKFLLLAGGADARQLPVLSQQVLGAAAEPIEKIRAVAVVGELEGAATALKRLDELELGFADAELQADARALRAIYSGKSKLLPAAERQRLIARHHWFAELALSSDRPAGDPLRQEVLSVARRAVTSAWSFIVIASLALFAGVVLMILAIIRYGQGRLRCAYVPLASSQQRPGVFVEGFAIYFLLFLAVSVALGSFLVGRSVWSNLLLVLAPLAAMIWIRLRGVRGSELSLGLGWHRGRGLWREIGAGITGYVTGLPLLTGGMIATLLLLRQFGGGQQIGHPIQNMPMQTAGQIVQLLLLASVLAPLTEELMFRGALLHSLRGTWGWLVSALIVSLLFAAIHPQGWMAIPVLVSIAMVLAALREWRGSIVASMTAHALNNTAAMTLLLLTMR